MNLPTLLDTVARRIWMAKWWRLSLGIASAILGVALLLLLTSRFLAWPPPLPPKVWWFVLPATAFLISLPFLRRPDRYDVARMIDTHVDAKDLFVTATELDESHKEKEHFAPLVLQQAREKAPSVQPREVVPFALLPPLRVPAVMTLLLIAAWFWLPQMDPFGKAQIASQEEEQRKLLEDLRRQTAERAQTLASRRTEASKPLEKEVDKLLESFKEAKPVTKDSDLKTFAEHQKNLGDLWKKVQDQKLAEGLKDAAEQSFGAMGNEEAKKIREALRNKDLDTVKKEIQELQKEARELAGKSDPQEQRDGARDLEKKISELAEALQNELGGESLKEAMERAADQAASTPPQGGELGQEALEAAAESLSLAEQELDNLEQMMQNEELMQDALEALQQAKKLAQEGKMDGEGNGPGQEPGEGQGQSAAEKLEAYQKYFEEMMGQLAGGSGEGPGPGMKGAGTGEGGKAPEDDDTVTDFKTERASSPLTAGKTLLDWKQKGVGQDGTKTTSYDESIQTLKQGASEAIIKERIPAGYHEGINKYFDTIDQIEPKVAEPAKPTPPLEAP